MLDAFCESGERSMQESVSVTNKPAYLVKGVPLHIVTKKSSILPCIALPAVYSLLRMSYSSELLFFIYVVFVRRLRWEECGLAEDP